MRLLKNKRGQEEIVGFVIIILLVSIAALVFLGISLRKTTPVESSVKVENFLTSALGYTTDCSLRRIPNYLSVGELVKECYEEERCFSGRASCEVLNQTMRGIMDSSFQISEETPLNYYRFHAYYLGGEDEEVNEDIYTLEKGNCTGIRSGNTQSLSALPGIIRIELETCTV